MKQSLDHPDPLSNRRASRLCRNSEKRKNWRDPLLVSEPALKFPVPHKAARYINDLGREFSPAPRVEYLLLLHPGIKRFIHSWIRREFWRENSPKKDANICSNLCHPSSNFKYILYYKLVHLATSDLSYISLYKPSNRPTYFPAKTAASSGYY